MSSCYLYCIAAVNVNQSLNHTTHCHILNNEIYVQKRLDPEGLFTKPGHWKPKTWTDGASSDVKEYERGDWTPLSLKSLPQKMHFKPFRNPFSYSITSILSYFVHSNTFFLTFSFDFPCRPLGALVRLPCRGGGTAIAMQVWVSQMFRKTAES